MPTWSPCKRRDFIGKLRKLGFAGPFPGKWHGFMTFGGLRQTIPNDEEYATPQVRMLIRQIELRIGRAIALEERGSL